jgi:predicted ABC-type ATPase
MAVLVMVAGPNGSGKSTLISALRSDRDIGPNLPATYINADDIQRSTGLDSAEAQRAAAGLRASALAARDDLMYETVMSHPSKLAELQLARAAGYEVHVFFLATEDPSINVRRVALRVAAGGHPVPEERTRQRYERTLALAPAALALADRAFVYDNSVARLGMQLQAVLVDRRLEPVSDTTAKWVAQLVACVNARADELASIQQRAQANGAVLEAARLDGGETEGLVGILGDHYAVQQDARTRALVLHDLSLLPGRQALEPGRTYRIGYAEGVGWLKGTSSSARP